MCRSSLSHIRRRLAPSRQSRDLAVRRGGAETNDDDKRNDNGCGSVAPGCADQVVPFSRWRRDCVPKAIPSAKEGKGGRVDGRDRRRRRRRTTDRRSIAVVPTLAHGTITARSSTIIVEIAVVTNRRRLTKSNHDPTRDHTKS